MPSAVSQPAATIPSTPSPPAPDQPVKTLSELYRTFDAINAAADATTPESLKTLVDYASTENADVRSEALNALIRRGDASAAPGLRTAAKQSDSSEETIDLLQTADYLELPSADLTAIIATAKANKAAANGSKRPGPAAAVVTSPAPVP